MYYGVQQRAHHVCPQSRRRNLGTHSSYNPEYCEVGTNRYASIIFCLGENSKLFTFNRYVNFAAPKLDGPPAIGQLVLAKYVDGNYYRAIVTKLVDGKVSVSYVDYGNRDLITIDELLMLSDDLKEVR